MRVVIRGVQAVLDHPVMRALAPGPDAYAVAGPAALEVRVAPADLELVRGLGGCRDFTSSRGLFETGSLVAMWTSISCRRGFPRSLRSANVYGRANRGRGRFKIDRSEGRVWRCGRRANCPDPMKRGTGFQKRRKFRSSRRPRGAGRTCAVDLRVGTCLRSRRSWRERRVAGW